MSDPQRAFAVVTGGSNGIGFELTRQFLDNGSNVLIAAQGEGHLRDAVAQLSGTDGTVTSWAGDLGQESQVEAPGAAIKAAGRPVDTLCVNAGFGLSGSFVDTDLRRELSMTDANVRGAVQPTKLVLKDPGVSVTAPMPSMTETNFLKWTEMMDTKAGTANEDDPAVATKVHHGLSEPGSAG